MRRKRNVKNKYTFGIFILLERNQHYSCWKKNLLLQSLKETNNFFLNNHMATLFAQNYKICKPFFNQTHKQTEKCGKIMSFTHCASAVAALPPLFTFCVYYFTFRDKSLINIKRTLQNFAANTVIAMLIHTNSIIACVQNA